VKKEKGDKGRQCGQMWEKVGCRWQGGKGAVGKELVWESWGPEPTGGRKVYVHVALLEPVVWESQETMEKGELWQVARQKWGEV